MNVLFVECFLLRGRVSIMAAILCLAALFSTMLTIPDEIGFGFLIVSVFVFAELYGELGRNEGLLDFADRWLAVVVLILCYIVFDTAFCFVCSSLTGMPGTDTMLMGLARIVSFIYCYFVRRVAYDDAISGNQAAVYAGERVSRMKSVCICAIATPYFARRFIPSLLARYRAWSDRRTQEMIAGLMKTLQGFEEKER